MKTTTIIDSFALKLKTCVREVKGKRQVFSGTWQGKEVFVKVFISPKGALRHWQRDLEGIKAFTEAGIETPGLLWSGKFPLSEGSLIADNAYGIIVEAVKDAVTLEDKWRECKSRPELLKKVVAVLASHHRQGLVQTDLHFGNFLFSGNKCYSLDGDALQVFPGKVPIGPAAKNYALFMVQADLSCETLFLNAISDYCQYTGYEEDEFRSLVEKQVPKSRKKRCHKLLQKIYRECSAVRRYDNNERRTFINSDYDCEELRGRIDNPDSLFHDQRAKLLKDGNSSTVAVTTISGRPVVIKRYNYNKNIKTFVRRFRTSRASTSWRNAFRLLSYGFKTPQPIAFIETFKGPMIRYAYFVSEYLEGMDLLTYFKQAGNEAQKVATTQKIGQLFNLLKKCHIAHGDCKATNFILHNNEVYIIDLDAMKEHSGRKSFQLAHRKDVKRWMKNWEGDKKLSDAFKAILRA